MRMGTGEQSYEPVRLHALNWKPSEFKGTKVMSVILPDGREIKTKTWRSAVEVILKDCAADPMMHEGLLYLCGRVNGNFRPLLSSRKSEMDVPIEIEDGLYFEGKLDTEQLLRVLVEKVLEPVGYDCSAVLLKHRETVQLPHERRHPAGEICVCKENLSVRPTAHLRAEGCCARVASTRSAPRNGGVH